VHTVCPVVWLDEKSDCASPWLGNKGANLARMRQAGYPVPAGFVITAQAYVEFIAANGLGETSLADRLQEAFIHGTYPREQQEAILTAYRRLGSPAVAVRSSATAEDLPTASFAGQQSSFLNVTGEAALLEAIRRCWSSLWSERAVAYRRDRDQLSQVPQMAVVVQTMIPCDVAGVAFSVDPLTGAETVVIEAAPGLGEHVVSGMAEVERYTVDRGKVVASHSLRHGNLTADHVQEIAKTTIALERFFGAPQDVEWGFWKGALYLFQSRPVTVSSGSFYTEILHGDDHLWTSGFLNERFPQPVSPLGWTLIRELLEPLALRDPLRYLGCSMPLEFPVVKLYRGHPFVNVSVFQRLYKLFPDFLLPEDARRFFPGGDTRLRHQVKVPRGWFDPRLWLSLFWHWILDPVNGSPWHNYRCWTRFVHIHERGIGRLWHQAETLAENSSMETAIDIVSEAQAISRRLLTIHRWSLTYAEMWYSGLRRLLAAWIGGEQGGRLSAQLVAGLPNKSVELNQALAELATNVAGQVFMAKYGHRSLCLDIYHPTFREQPELVKMLRQPGGRQPDVRVQAAQRESARAEVRQLLRRQKWGWLKARVFDKVLYYAQRYLPLREDQRFYWQKILAIQRKIFLRIGQQMVHRGWLKHQGAVFFATLDEVRGSLAGAAFPSAEIARRQLEFSRLNQDYALAPHLSYPVFLRGSQPLTESGDEINGVLRGQPVSPGLARGPVRIVTTPDQLDRIIAGDILVTRGADPGWTPVFGRLAGLVMEMGGQLSHGAVVAREYGLPAIAGVPGVTQRLKDGQQIIVDGLAGTVTPVDETAVESRRQIDC
jgi:rifampicin phosphotransferase